MVAADEHTKVHRVTASRRVGIVLAALLALVAAANPAAAKEIVLDQVSDGFSSPLFVDAPGGDDRLFVVERGGRIRILHPDGSITTYLDIDPLVLSGGERGLLGLAFHPDYGSNGLFYVNYTDNSGDTVIAEYEVSGDPDIADPASARPLLTVGQPDSNHNGGMLAFGPDGCLYVGLGDGGGGNDTYGNGQDPFTLLGTILRLDTDGNPCAAPPGNPFDGSDGAEEVWAWGLRNPWRFSFDPDNGFLYIGDVGQGAWEEIDVIGPTHAGANFGWPNWEGMHCSSDCGVPDYVPPVHEYDHSEGISVTGGHVYRGSVIPGIDGHYFYGDFGSGTIWSFTFDTATGTTADHRDWTSELGTVSLISSFGTDGHGELYVVSLGGAVHKLTLGADRIWGPDRYATAVEVAESEFPGTDVVYLALGTNFPDALVAASRGDGPVVLTNQAALPEETASLLADLAPIDTLYIVGGPAAISGAVETAVGAYATEVIRLAGADRLETAAAFSERLNGTTGGVVFVATAKDYPDALVAARAASHESGSVLLVDDEVPAATAAELTRLSPSTIYVVGGTTAISAEVKAALEAYTPSVIRLGGSDRYDTARLVSEAFFPEGSPAWIATGLDFVDALVAAAGAAPTGATVLLVRDDLVPAPTATELTRLVPPAVTVVGGTAVVTRQVQADLGGYIP